MRRSEVYFDERSHTYWRGEQQLSGITSLIHDVLRVGIYPDADEYVRQVTIPQAGYYGHCVHQCIQTYDTLGVEVTEYPSITIDTLDYGVRTTPQHDVSKELASYLKARSRRRCDVAASEFLVDYGMYASSIDSVWTTKGGKVYLVDFKTNNLTAYPGGKSGLKEYLSWQLSCYAVMFERQTGLKVEGLLGLWLRGDKSQLWVIERKPDAQVLSLLDTTATLCDDGTFTYFNPDMQAPLPAEVVPGSDALAVPVDVVNTIARLLEYEQQAKELKEQLRTMMEEAGVKKWECDRFTATIGTGGTTTTFDKNKFIEDYPDLAEQYVRQVERKASFTIKLK